MREKDVCIMSDLMETYGPLRVFFELEGDELQKIMCSLIETGQDAWSTKENMLDDSLIEIPD